MKVPGCCEKPVPPERNHGITSQVKSFPQLENADASMDPPRVEPATIEDLPALTELVMDLFSRSGDFKPDHRLNF